MILFLNILYALCIFVGLWMGLLFIGNIFNQTLSKLPALNIFLLALSLTGVITHCIGLW